MVNKILDLFAGVGGLSLGFELIKNDKGNKIFELHRAVEIDKYACATLRKNFGPEKVIEGDLTKKEIHDQVIRECQGKVSVIMGGIPCQSFSLLGPRSGYGRNNEKFKEDRRDYLYKEFRDIVKAVKPRIIVLENVRGILSKKTKTGQKIIDEIISDFEGLGYNLKTEKGDKKYQLLNSADFGVPQQRHRVFIIGTLKSWKEIDIPCISPTHFNPTLTDIQRDNPLLPYVTLFEALGGLIELQPKITPTGLSKNEKLEIETLNASRNNGADITPLKKKKLKKHLARISASGRQFFKFIGAKKCSYTYHHTARSQQFSDISLFEAMKEGETAKDFVKREPELGRKLIKYDMQTFQDKYRKQHSHRPSTTIFAHMEKDGNRFIHPSQARTLTPREAARLQSFPDYFIFEGPMSKKFRQIGNAVPPRMSFNIASQISNMI